jgi:tRNA(Ile)-lysidine synthase TilS/MesJ
MSKQLTHSQEIERSIIKKYRKELWAPFLTAINRYDLINEGDRIAVCISGGKDSMCMAEMLMMLQRHSDRHFDLVYIVMDPGYNTANRAAIEANLKTLEIPAKVFETNIFAVADSYEKKPCYLCARMRRGHLYNKAQELGCNKIALGHHLNDAIETALMSMFWSSKLETIIPKARSEHFKDLELIRPMYCVHEDSIKAWARYNDLHFIQCACRFTADTADTVSESKRQEAKLLIRELKKENPDIEDNMFRALHAVHLKCFPGYVLDGDKHSFNEYYEEPDKDIPNPFKNEETH